MSIGTVNNIVIEPVLREPEKYKATTPGLLARWWGTGAVQGDVSGGSMTSTLLFAGTVGMFGQYALFSFEDFTYIVNDTITYAQMSLDTYVASSIAAYPIRLIVSYGSYSISQHNRTTPVSTFKFRLSKDPSNQSSISMNVDNLNTKVLIIYAVGYIWDERQL